jgi:pectinesterase
MITTKFKYSVILKIFFILLTITQIAFPNSSAKPKQLFVKVQNPANIERQNETVVLKWSDIKKKAAWLDSSKLILTETGVDKELITQKLEHEFLFQANFKPNETKIFVLSYGEEKKEAILSVTNAVFTVPRKDVAWENDRIAYRIYGGPLAGDVRNGIDVWVKRVKYQIIDQWYNGDSLKGSQRISYHVDHGEGADFFLVGKSLGAGGSALWRDSLFHQSALFTSHKIIATGPIRAKFMVAYEGDSIDGKPFKEEKIFSLDAGSNLSRIDVKYSGLKKENLSQIACGLVKRSKTNIKLNETNGWLSLWGQTDGDSTNGFLGTAVVLSQKSFVEMAEDKEHYLIIGSNTKDKNFTYYAGAGWTRSGDFNSSEDWENYLTNFSLCLRNPVKVTISTQKF